MPVFREAGDLPYGVEDRVRIPLLTGSHYRGGLLIHWDGKEDWVMYIKSSNPAIDTPYQERVDRENASVFENRYLLNRALERFYVGGLNCPVDTYFITEALINGEWVRDGDGTCPQCGRPLADAVSYSTLVSRKASK